MNNWNHDQAVRYLDRAMTDNGTVELRILGKQAIASGIYTDKHKLLGDAITTGQNAYITMNAPSARPPTNTLRWLTRQDRGVALGDSDIARYTRFTVDVDPVRPKGSNSNDRELAAALEVRGRVVAYLGALGWPPPTLAMSGNGYHAVYRCKYPVNDESRAAMREVYRGLASRFSTNEVIVDPTLFNPSRILRLYGTVNSKAPATNDRPQRLSVCTFQTDWRCVLPRQIQQLAKTFAPKPRPKPERTVEYTGGDGDYSTLDVVGFMQSHGLYKRPFGDGRHTVRCPWSNEHSDEDWFDRTDVAIWEARGGLWPQFYCMHAHCNDRRIIDVIRQLGGADKFCTRRRQA